MLNSQSRRNQDDEIDDQPKDLVVVVLCVVALIAVLIIPIGMMLTGRGGPVAGLLLLFLRLFLLALPVYLAYRTIRLLLQKRWKKAGTLAIATLVVAVICAIAFIVLIPVTIQ